VGVRVPQGAAWKKENSFMHEDKSNKLPPWKKDIRTHQLAIQNVPKPKIQRTCVTGLGNVKDLSVKAQLTVFFPDLGEDFELSTAEIRAFNSKK
jgi:hypothetical protein